MPRTDTVLEQAGAPTVSDDANSDFLIGSEILDTNTNILWECLDNSVGAAVWVKKLQSDAAIVTGTYTGDGTTSQAITGLGFQPKFLKIIEQETADNSTVYSFETTDVIIDDIVGGASIRKTDIDIFRHKDNRIVSLDSDGFTVSDDSIDAHPNKDTRTYNYIAIG